MPPVAAPVILTAVPLVTLVAEILELLVSAEEEETFSVKDLTLTVPALSLTLIWTVYLPVEAGVHECVVAVL